MPIGRGGYVRVQFWCAYAEVLLGEASFGSYSTH
jgi:hypothetical protein